MTFTASDGIGGPRKYMRVEDLYDFEAQALMEGDGDLMTVFILLFHMANELPILGSLALRAYSDKLDNQMKVWLSEEVGSKDDFAQDMNEHCYLVKKEMKERDQLMLELQKLVVSEGAVRYLKILRRRQERDAVKLGLLRDLLRHARDETHQRQLDLNVVDYS
nr:hypothetical protein [Tanacetum cinerariifolium]